MTNQIPIPIVRDQVSIVNLTYVDTVGSMVNIFRIPGADPDDFMSQVCDMTDTDPDDVMPCIWHLTAIYPTERRVYSVVTHSFTLGGTLFGAPTTIRAHAVINSPYCRAVKIRPLDSDGSPVYAVYDYMNFVGIRLGVGEDGEQDIYPIEDVSQRYAVDDLLSGGNLVENIEKFLSETTEEPKGETG